MSWTERARRVVVRPPAVAGMFYPASASDLRRQVDELLASAGPIDAARTMPKALIVPHAGYVYSGAIAASAYARIVPHADRIRRVVLLGPAHRVALRGLATPGARRFATPLGEVDLAVEAIGTLGDLPYVNESPDVHVHEHSLEVQLPFLQCILGNFELVPLAVGDASADQVAAVLDRLWGDAETLIVISSDLSHYQRYEAARVTDRATVAALLALDGRLQHEQACGATPINGLLQVAQRRGMRAELLDLRNSGDTAGDRDRVVGYAAVGLYEADTDATDAASRAQRSVIDKGAALLAHARAAIAGELGLTPPRAQEAAFLDALGATFVTLRSQAQLRGCIGSLEALRPLRVDVRANAIAAAFSDPRFAPLARAEYETIDVEVSLLSSSTPVMAANEADLCAQLRPGIDGVTLELDGRRGTFLPQVWDALSDPREFLAQLKRKAGLPADFWSSELQISRYTVEKWAESKAL